MKIVNKKRTLDEILPIVGIYLRNEGTSALAFALDVERREADIVTTSKKTDAAQLLCDIMRCSTNIAYVVQEAVKIYTEK